MIQGCGWNKHNELEHTRKARCLVCPKFGSCDVWWNDFVRHLLEAHMIITPSKTSYYYRENVRPFFKLHRCPTCFFRHYTLAVVELHSKDCSKGEPVTSQPPAATTPDSAYSSHMELDPPLAQKPPTSVASSRSPPALDGYKRGELY